MNKLTRQIYKLLGRIVLDDYVLEVEGPKLLHLSDTPSLMYSELKRVLDVLKPEYIIHTGDLVDDIKLQLKPSLSFRYEREIQQLMKIFNQCSAKRIVITLGNHDQYDLVMKYAGRVEVHRVGSLEKIDQLRVACAHYYKDAFKIATIHQANYCLYGHDLSECSQKYSDRENLNGIEAMHLVAIKTGYVATIHYPMGTDSARLNRNRIGI